LETDTNAITAVHALHTLNALNGLSFPLLEKYARADDALLAAHALLAMEQFAATEYVQSMVQLSQALMERDNGVINLYLPVALRKWNEIAPSTFLPLIMKLFRQVPEKTIYQEAIVSGVPGLEDAFRDSLALFIKQERGGKLSPGAKILDSLLAMTIKNRAEKKMNPIFAEARTPVDARTNGLTLFRNNCASCHGADGAGIELVAPPLTESEYVSGSTSRLAMIILNGLEGPIHINGKEYKFNNTMPTFASNLSNEQIVDIIRFMQNAYVNTPVKSITAGEVEKLRKNTLGTLKESDLIKLAKEDK
jgi:mono/diheme cytochrome c family protein